MNQRYCILSRVKQGGLSRNIIQFREALAHFEGKDITISIERTRKKRSDNQNRYLHMTIRAFTLELNELGNSFTQEEIKDYLRDKFLKTEVVNQETGEVIGNRARHTSELSTTDMAVFIDQIIAEAAQFNIILPYPNEQFTVQWRE